MNLIIFEASDYLSSTVIRLQGRKFEHMINVQKVKHGEKLNIGLLNGAIGQGTIIDINEHSIEMVVDLSSTPPPALPVTVLLALPRPKMLKRSLQTLSSMGVKNIFLINSYRVEKSYWSSPELHEEKIRDNLLLGLEQAKDTLMPDVTQKRRFKPFVEDDLPELMQKSKGYVAHPSDHNNCPSNIDSPTVLAIGPEGGFTDYEIQKFIQAGFETIGLGQRILRVETAIPVLLAKLFY